MYKLTIYFFVIVLLAVACKSGEEVQKPYVKLKKGSDARISYYLPKNAYHVQLTLVRTQQFKGPFSDFAGEYLGINENTVKFDDVNYQIADADVNLITYPDPAEYYHIHLDDNRIVTLNVTEEGILAGINTQNINRINNPEIKDHLPPKQNFVFTDLSVKPIVDITEEVSYEYKKIDSALVRVPVEKEVTEVKNFQEMAWSAAKFISTLRESRFRLLAGISETDHVPETVTGRTEALDILEQRYLELFTGHTIHDTLVYNFVYEPDPHLAEDTQEILFYFSESNGIRIKSKGAENDKLYGLGTPVYFRLVPEVLPERKNKSRFEQIEPMGLIYRSAARAQLEVKMKDRILVEGRFPVAQWGSRAFLPATLLYDTTHQLNFDPRTGQLLEIRKK